MKLKFTVALALASGIATVIAGQAQVVPGQPQAFTADQIARFTNLESRSMDLTTNSLRLLIFVAVFATLLTLGEGTAHAAGTCNVPSVSYPTIQSAVNDSNCSTINVAAGFYPEQVTIGRTLILNGAQTGVDARTRPFVPANESIIDDPCGPVQIEADQVVLNGFTIQGSTLPDPCFLAGIWTNPGFSGTQGGHQILNNIVQNNISGIELDSTCVFATLVQFNLIQNNSNPGPGSGNGIQTNFGLCGATIDRNKFSGDTSSSVLVVATSSNLVVTNNELVGGTPERIFLANTTASSITGNVSIGSTSSGTIRLFSGNSKVTISGNTLFNGLRGIRVNDLDPLAGGANSSIQAHFNCIQGNSLAGLEVAAGDYTGIFHAENNWWGSRSGPNEVPRNTSGMGDKIIDPDQNVDFIPFLTSCPTGAVAPSMVTGGGQVPVNMTGGKGTFGFNAKQDTQSGHLNYLNHATGAHLDCNVNTVTIISATKAQFSGTSCSPNSSARSFMARVEDNAEPGKGADKFFITYGTVVDEGGTLISGNIQIH
jgi:nitrous oxidase accessory protein NosD